MILLDAADVLIRVPLAYAGVPEHVRVENRKRKLRPSHTDLRWKPRETLVYHHPTAD